MFFVLFGFSGADQVEVGAFDGGERTVRKTGVRLVPGLLLQVILDRTLFEDPSPLAEHYAAAESKIVGILVRFQRPKLHFCEPHFREVHPVEPEFVELAPAGIPRSDVHFLCRRSGRNDRN